jgi:peptidyl-prolyl cis-trans isomerase B (cyclophilin B)
MSCSGWVRSLIYGGLCLVASGVITGCAAEGNASRPIGCATASTPCLSGSATVAMDTSKGQVRFELDGAAAPLTARCFTGWCVSPLPLWSRAVTPSAPIR